MRGGGRGRGAYRQLAVESRPDFRWYPRQGWVVGYVSGVAASLASVDTSVRTVTLAAAPGVVAIVKSTHQGLRFVRVSEPSAFQGATKQFGRHEFALEKVLRD